MLGIIAAGVLVGLLYLVMTIVVEAIMDQFT